MTDDSSVFYPILEHLPITPSSFHFTFNSRTGLFSISRNQIAAMQDVISLQMRIAHDGNFTFKNSLNFTVKTNRKYC